MKRHAALRQLSREHHAALVLARHIASCPAEPAAVKRMCDEVTQRFADELRPHFDEEEATLLPRLPGRHRAQARRIQSEHAAMRSLVRRIADLEDEALRQFGRLLAEHVRFEEREFFPLVEAQLASTDPRSIALSESP